MFRNKKIFLILYIILSGLPVSNSWANSISYDQSHHSYSVFHYKLNEQELKPTIHTDSFIVKQNVIVLSDNKFFGVSSSLVAPTAANVGEYGRVLVGMFTGTTSINIPLYTFKTRNLSGPISLSYPLLAQICNPCHKKQVIISYKPEKLN